MKNNGENGRVNMSNVKITIIPIVLFDDLNRSTRESLQFLNEIESIRKVCIPINERYFFAVRIPRSGTINSFSIKAGNNNKNVRKENGGREISFIVSEMTQMLKKFEIQLTNPKRVPG